jgi:hypothetical protein
LVKKGFENDFAILTLADDVEGEDCVNLFRYFFQSFVDVDNFLHRGFALDNTGQDLLVLHRRIGDLTAIDVNDVRPGAFGLCARAFPLTIP